MNFLRSRFHRYFDRRFEPLARKSDLDNIYAQFASLLNIRDIIGPDVVALGPLRGWAISPDSLEIILRDLHPRNAPKVLEFGAGESTIAISAMLKRMGCGSLITVEHDVYFAEKIIGRIKKTDLQMYSTIQIVPMRKYGTRLGLPEFTSYDLSDVDVDFDLALIDGPIMHQFGAATRSVPLDWCVNRLRNDCVIYLHDAARSEEASIVKGSKNKWLNVDLEMIGTEKGLLRLGRTTSISEHRT